MQNDSKRNPQIYIFWKTLEIKAINPKLNAWRAANINTSVTI